MTIPSYQTLMLPALRLASDGEIRVSDAIERLAVSFELTEKEKTQLLPSGSKTVFSDRFHWAKTYLLQAGLLSSSRRAYFAITMQGREVLSRNPAQLDKEYLRQFPEFVTFLNRRKRSIEGALTEEHVEIPDDKTPDEVLRAAANEREQALRKQLLDRILAKPPEFFEQLVVTLLIAMGYGGSLEEAGRKLGRSGDGGVDGVIDQDALSLDQVYIQAKRYALSNRIGSGTIREFFGSLDRFKSAKGLIITTSSFTSDAIETVERLSKRIVLIDGDQLATLMIRHNVGCRVEETIYLKKLDEDFFEED
jgi:restriction system protein